MTSQRERYEKQVDAILDGFQKKQGIAPGEVEFLVAETDCSARGPSVAEDSTAAAARTDGCYSSAQLAALVDRVLPPEEEVRMRVHLQGCESCRQQCMKIAALKMGSVRTGAPSTGRKVWRYGCMILVLAAMAGVAVWYSWQYLYDGNLPF